MSASSIARESTALFATDEMLRGVIADYWRSN
jgi:hypothetical protein